MSILTSLFGSATTTHSEEEITREELGLPPRRQDDVPVFSQAYVHYMRFNDVQIDHLLDTQPEAKMYFSRIIGQEKAKRRLARIAKQAYKHPYKDDDSRTDHQCARNIMIEGPSSSGKTTVVRVLVRDILAIPLVELDANTFIGAKMPKATILFEISKCLLKWNDFWKGRGLIKADNPVGFSLVELPGQRFCPPPMAIFIDEAHKLPKPVQDALLKATERKDRMMQTENGFTVDCSRICWILATTRRGELREEFDNRFKKIRLRLYNKEEIAQIVQLNYPQWPWEVCMWVAHYTPRVPREALDFAEDLADEMTNRGQNWKAALQIVAEDAEIDKWGMTSQRLTILRALGQQGPMSLKRLSGVAECDEETLRERVLPALLASTPNEPALMGVTHRHFITPAGLAELDKRGIRHLGKKALPKDYVEMEADDGDDEPDAEDGG